MSGSISQTTAPHVGRPVARQEPGRATLTCREVGMYGLRVRSAIDLPEWPDAPPGEPDASILLDAPAPPTFEGATYNARVRRDQGAVHVEIRGVATYSVIDGECIRVAPEPGAKPEDVRLYLVGAMFGVLLHQRGVLPLHASAVAIDGTAIGFAAPSGSGKSTLLAALLRRGATFVTDDICALLPVEAGVTRVWPGAPRVKLDEQGIAALEEQRSGFEPAGGNRGKFHVPVEVTPAMAAPLPLARVYLLQFGDGPVRLERLSGLDAISALLDETYMLAFASDMGLRSQVFARVAAVSRTLDVCRLIRPKGFEHMDEVLDLIARDVGSRT